VAIDISWNARFNGRYTMAKKKRERATELEYLKWFRIYADFGPADSDIQDIMDKRFMRETGKLLPKGWNFDAYDGETSMDGYLDNLDDDDYLDTLDDEEKE
jgi:hypothetical protein